MNRNDEQLEALLHEFEPRKPQPLPPPASEDKWRRRLVAAAVVILVASASLWLATRRADERKPDATENASTPRPEATPAAPKLSLVALTHMAQSDTQKLDATLDNESRSSLPGFQRKDSTLASLAKE